ncbi:MAG: acetoacetate decarboxylase [Cellvibrionaceae bacterium]|jgi:acetoacetate decarboxylase
MGKNVVMLAPKAIHSYHDELVNPNRRTDEDTIVGTDRYVEVERNESTKVCIF